MKAITTQTAALDTCRTWKGYDERIAVQRAGANEMAKMQRELELRLEAYFWERAGGNQEHVIQLGTVKNGFELKTIDEEPRIPWKDLLIARITPGELAAIRNTLQPRRKFIVIPTT